MALSRLAVLLAFALVLCLPFMVRQRAEQQPAAARPAGAAQSLIVITPHIEPIRAEFGDAFTRWHARTYPSDPPATIDWRVPGGTSEIVKQLSAQYEAALKNAARSGKGGGTGLRVLKRSDDGKSVEVTLEDRSMATDVMLGGGSFEHNQLKRGVTATITLDGHDVAATVRISEPAGFPERTLLGEQGLGEGGWFEKNKIGNQFLFDPEQYWIGTALSGFGIVYNRLVLRDLGLPEPASFQDLTDARYTGMLALADPRQSGSITTTYESILNKEGWDEGWRILRDMCASARSFAGTSTKPPIDVSLGEAAAGLAIDFYGRGQAQAILEANAQLGTPEPGLAERVGYVDPKGAVYIDADPVSILRACPHPELARRFVEFCMTEEAQALWQFRAISTPAGATNPPGPDGRPMGPARYELRRMPARQVMYRKYMDYFVDKVNPFDLAAELPDRRWRSSISLMMGAFGIDTHDELRRAWAYLTSARAAPAFPKDTLAEMEKLFYAFPSGAEVQRLFSARFPSYPLPEAAHLDFSRAITDADDKQKNPRGEDNCRRIMATWADAGLKSRLKIVYTEFFRENYRHIVGLARSAAR